MRPRHLVGMLSFAFVCVSLIPVVVADDKKAANVAGTWTWKVTRNDQEFTTTLKLKQEGSKVTGTISGRQGNNDTEISEGKIEGADVSFQVTREFNGNSIVIKYKGKVEGDTIKGKTVITRDGNEMERDWEAKREKSEEKKA